MMHTHSNLNNSNVARKIPRGRPAFAETQRDEILRLLREAGPIVGVSRATLIFERHMTQCGTRIFELQKMGYVIRSENRGGRYPTWYVLESEPLELQSLPEDADWYTRATGRERPTESRTDDLPLFAAAQQ
jgi:hypothetical protein